MVGDAHVNALNDDDAVEGYWAAQSDNMPNMVVVARFAGTPPVVTTAARSISESLDPRLFPEIHPLKQLYHDITLQIEQIAGVVSLIGMIAILLAAVGITGLVGFSISQRTKEIAIRLALESSKPRLCVALLKQFGPSIVSGFAAGTLLAVFSSKFLRIALFGVSNLDPVGFAGGIGILFGVVLFAGILPARRAMRLNVARALHYE